MNISPVAFATSVFRINGMPMHMPPDTMRHLFPIYNRKSNAMLLKFGRQTHKSTTIGNKLTLPCLKYPNYHALYVSPTGNQVSVFSTDKLDGTLRGSEIISSHYVDTSTKDQVYYKEMVNGSRIYLRSAFHSADSIRGISADETCLDEIQDMISDHIPVIEQCMSHSLAKFEQMKEVHPGLPMHLFNSRIYAGTPKTMENTLEKYWGNSSQNEWIIKCTHCNKWNYINENNIGPTCLICNKCGKPIYYQDGRWISMNPDGFIDGYRLPQIVLEWINNPRNPEAWKINVINTRKIYSTEKYFNEVLALPYANARHPLNIMEIRAVCKDDIEVIEPERAFGHPMISDLPKYAGIDWGKGDTANGTSYSMICIGTFANSRFRLLYMKRYSGRMSDPLLQVEDMLRIIEQYGVTLTLADTGDGRTSNAMMVQKLTASKFGEVYEHATLKQKIKWDRFKGTYLINRTRMMTDLFMQIKRAEVDFFNYASFQNFSDDFLGIYSEYSDRTRLTKYDHNIPDDAFHAYMFCRMAAGIHRGEYNKYLVGGMNEDQYAEDTHRILG